MAHIHDVYDTDVYFVIDPVTRMITNQSRKATVIQFDHNSERFTFEIPRYVEGHDMSACNAVEVHFTNQGRNGKRSGVYPVTDISVHPTDENRVICSWLIGEEATQQAGPLEFLVRYSCVIDGHTEYVWSTAPYSGITVTSGIYNGDYA